VGKSVLGNGATVIVTRGGYIESRHHVAYAVASADGAILESAGDIAEPVFMRSSAKPLVCAAIVASGAAEKFKLTFQEIAIIAGSHSGEPRHVDAVRRILSKIGLTEHALRCGAHSPLHEPSALALTAGGKRPSPVHNNCSGNHAGILALAVHRGYSVQGYLARAHPVQEELLTRCAELLAVPYEGLPVAVDGCGMPAIAVSLRATATFYAKLSNPKIFGDRWDSAIGHVCRAMISHPEYVGGTGRFDTDLMNVAAPRLICKSGAEGYHATSVFTNRSGMALKVIDGNDRAVAPFVIQILVSEEALQAHQTRKLAQHRQPPILNHSRDAVGHILVQTK
jgi:L-asparaginase II